MRCTNRSADRGRGASGRIARSASSCASRITDQDVTLSEKFVLMLYGKWILFLGLSASCTAGAQEAKTSIASIEALIHAHNYSQALDTTRSALRENPRDVRLWTLEAIALSLSGDKHAALTAFDKALSFSPKYPAALRGKAEILYEARDRRAIPVLEEILSSDPKDATANEMLAVLEQKQGN